jgi:hypothetical protein
MRPWLAFPLALMIAAGCGGDSSQTQAPPQTEPVTATTTAEPDLPHLDIPRWQGENPPAIDGHLEPAWHNAAVVGNFSAPWHESGPLEETVARLAWDDHALYVVIGGVDENVSAEQSNRDDPVSRDDCVEVFFAPDPDSVQLYFNYEFNALGTILDRSPHNGRSSDWDAAGLRVAVNVAGTLNDPSDVDRGWIAEIAIPFADLAPYGAVPQPGQRWRLNLYRIGDSTNRQYRAWSDTRTERPQFHAPERFGVVRFVR